jgi:hypothetical protein
MLTVRSTTSRPVPLGFFAAATVLTPTTSTATATAIATQGLRMRAPFPRCCPGLYHVRTVRPARSLPAGLQSRPARTRWPTNFAIPRSRCGSRRGPTRRRSLPGPGTPQTALLSTATPPLELLGRIAGQDRITTDPQAALRASSTSPAASATWTGRSQPLALPVGRAVSTSIALAEIVRRVGESPHAWPVGRTRLQKLAYFATVAGVPTGFRFMEASYGPYADGLKPALTRLVNNGVLTEQRIGRMLAVEPGPSFTDAAARYRAKIAPHEPAIQRVTDLLARPDSDETELAASVHFAAALRSELGRTPSDLEVLQKIQHWKRRRTPPLNDRDVVAAIRDLAALGWIEVTATHLPPGDAASVA